MPVDIPIGAEDSPESPGDSPESSDFEASPQDAEKFVLALHNRTKEKDLRTFVLRSFLFAVPNFYRTAIQKMLVIQSVPPSTPQILY